MCQIEQKSKDETSEEVQEGLVLCLGNKRHINVRVTTMDAELEFAIQTSITGKQLFDQVVKTIGLREVWYFGLQYTDNKGFPTWLKLNKKVTVQDIGKEQPLNFKFRAKFFPEDAQEELIQDITIRLFYLQVKDSILSDDVYCSPESSVLLASYAMQSKYGDYDMTYHATGFLSSDRLLPQRVLGQFKLNAEEWEKRIMVWWSDHRSMSKEGAMMEYLKLAQDLEMYGVNFFEIKNKKGSELYLGVDALGLNIYDKNDRLSPRVGFPWSEIRNISFNDKKFVIKPIDKKATDFIFYAPRLRINKRILALCMGNHELYMRRRKPDTIEIQQMRSQAADERKIRHLEVERLSKEVDARERAEQKQREAEEEIRRMMEVVTKTKEELNVMHEKYKQLETRYEEVNHAKASLERKEREMQDLNERLLSQKQMTEEEKHKLTREIRLHESEIVELRQTVEYKVYEANKLQDDLDALKSNHDEKRFVSEHDDLDDEMTNAHLELTVDEGVNMNSHPELDREPAVMNVSMKEKLELLTQELTPLRNRQQETDYDLLHQENRRAGRDKYKTLRQIRGGNTKRRIDQYENM
uniref:Moesin/ezrin/radixin homolog 1 n=1 Tax=Rhabditophanes sp. KR3021 TaxID=114890 RepID=A0AC35U0I9_9BILA